MTSRNEPARVYYLRKNAEGYFEWSLYAITRNVNDADKLADDLAKTENALEIRVVSDDPYCYEQYEMGDMPEIENCYDEDFGFDFGFDFESEMRDLYTENKRALSA